MHSHSGVTLAELLVSLVLLTIGLGALASSAAVLLHEAASSRRAERAAIIARTRLEQLRLAPCATGAGTAFHEGIAERWAVTTSERSAIATVRVGFIDRDRRVEHVYRTRVPC